MNRNLIIGLLLYGLYVVSEWREFHIVEALVLLSILLFVPMVLALLDTSRRDGTMLPLAKWVLRLYPYAAFSAVLAFFSDMAVFAAIWFMYTGIITLFGLSRLLERGRKPLTECSIDSGLLYLSLGGFWFFAYVAEIQVMHFTSLIVLLTAVHFHYSAFILPILAGFLGRKRSKVQKAYGIVMLIMIISPMTIAVGITYSRVIEFWAVLFYMAALYMYSFFVFRTTFQKKWAKILVSVSAVTLLVTISFSLIYAYGRVRESVTITIDEMILIHGVVNVFGVVLPALIGWMMEGTKSSVYPFYGRPMSRVFGSWTIGSEFLRRKSFISSHLYSGLVNEIGEFSSDVFHEKKLAPSIKDFYEQTTTYQLQAYIRWSVWFRPFAFVYQHISRRIGQIHLSMGGRWERMDGEVIGVTSEVDGREEVRAWVRKNEEGDTIFVALYSKHDHQGETYMNIALPLPFANMTGILKPYHEGRGLILTSVPRKEGEGDEGIYLHTPFFTVRLPLAETFFIKEEEQGGLTAHHQMWIFGLKFLEIDYQMEKDV